VVPAGHVARHRDGKPALVGNGPIEQPSTWTRPSGREFDDTMHRRRDDDWLWMRIWARNRKRGRGEVCSVTEARFATPSIALSAIRAALDADTAQAATPTPIVDRPVVLDSEICAVTEGLRTGEHRTLYADVPLSAIVGLFHNSFAPEATTWRELLTGLHGEGWGRDTLAYFESEMGDAHFPAPGAAHPLILRAYGGAVVCVNGMHRLVAGVCRLAARQGASAQFRKVELQYCDIKTAAVAVMRDAARHGARIEAAHDARFETVLIRAEASRWPHRARYWLIEGDSVSSAVRPPGTWLGRDRWRQAARHPQTNAGLRWQRVSDSVLAALANDGWLTAQLEAPRYPDAPC
jgi:hypothetical protein